MSARAAQWVDVLQFPTLLTWARIVAIRWLSACSTCRWQRPDRNPRCDCAVIIVALTDWADGYWHAGST